MIKPLFNMNMSRETLDDYYANQVLIAENPPSQLIDD